METKSFKVGNVDFKCYKYDYKSIKDFIKEFGITDYHARCYTKPNGKLTSKFVFKFGDYGEIELTSCTWLVVSSEGPIYMLKDSEVDNLDIFTETIAWIDNEVKEHMKDYKKDDVDVDVDVDVDDTDLDVEVDVDDVDYDTEPVTNVNNDLFKYAVTTLVNTFKTEDKQKDCCDYQAEIDNLKKENENLKKELDFFKKFIHSNTF